MREGNRKGRSSNVGHVFKLSRLLEEYPYVSSLYS